MFTAEKMCCGATFELSWMIGWAFIETTVSFADILRAVTRTRNFINKITLREIRNFIFVRKEAGNFFVRINHDKINGLFQMSLDFLYAMFHEIFTFSPEIRNSEPDFGASVINWCDGFIYITKILFHQPFDQWVFLIEFGKLFQDIKDLSILSCCYQSSMLYRK